MAMRRREFLQVAAVSSAGAAVFAGCTIPAKEVLVESPTHIPEDLISPYQENWYATTCDCGCGTGIIVRVVEGRAKKVEGNPDHPVSMGKSCPSAQASLQALYHPDRYQQPMKLSGQRGGGSYSNINWDDAINQAAAAIKGANAGRLVILTSPQAGAPRAILDRLSSTFGATVLSSESLEDSAYRTAAKAVFGGNALPDYDIANAQTVLSFSADWLGPWQSQVRQSIGYGAFRQGRSGVRGRLIHIGPWFSMTAANADDWVPCKPGQEGLVALAIAQSIMAQNLGDKANYPSGGAQALSAFSGQAVADKTGVPAEKITAIAKRLASEGPSLVIGGGQAGAHSNGTYNLTQILNLNLLLGNVGKPGGVMLNPDPALPNVPLASGADTFTDWQREMIRLRSLGKDAVVLIYGANPVFSLPSSLGVREAIMAAGTVISFSSMPDETSALADLILPSNHPLEDWGMSVPAVGPGYQVVSLQQPVVNRVFNTQPFGDTLLKISQAIGGDLARALPWATVKDATREFVQPLFESRRGSVAASTFEAWWNGALQRGGWWSTSATRAASAGAPSFGTSPEEPRFNGDDSYPYFLTVFHYPTLGKTGNAELPWLQQAPDPITSVAWGTWVEVNKKVAKALGVEEGDIVTVATPSGSIEAPIYINYANPDWTVSVPAGNGHSAGGRWAVNVGSNPLAILGDQTDQPSGGLAWNGNRAKVTKTGRRVRFAKLEGYVPVVQSEQRPVLEITNSD